MPSLHKEFQNWAEWLYTWDPNNCISYLCLKLKPNSEFVSIWICTGLQHWSMYPSAIYFKVSGREHNAYVIYGLMKWAADPEVHSCMNFLSTVDSQDKPGKNYCTMEQVLPFLSYQHKTVLYDASSAQQCTLCLAGNLFLGWCRPL